MAWSHWYNNKILPPFLFIRPKFELVLVPSDKTQSIIFLALIIFRLEISLIKKRERMYSQTIRREGSINDKDNYGKSYKFKTNLLLSTKLTIFLNLDELGNWVLYIGTEGVCTFDVL